MPSVRAVNWAALDHAYGKATDIPALLEKLVAPRAAERKAALKKLEAALLHQGGGFCTATPPAVPALLRTLQAPVFAEHAPLLRLIGDLTSAGHFNHLPFGMSRRDAEVEENTVYPLVAPSSAKLRAFLEHKSAIVRGSAALAVAFVPNDPSAAVEALLRALGVETDDDARASELLALAVAAREANDGRARVVVSALLASTTPLLRIVAAVGLVTLDPARVPAAAREVLLDAVKAPLRVPGLFWNGGNVTSLATLALDASLARASTADIVPLLDRVRGTPAEQTIARKLLDLAFPGEDWSFQAHPKLRSELTEPQQSVARLIWERGLVDEWSSDCSHAFRAHGLPWLEHEYRLVLGDGGGACALDREVGGRAHWHRLRGVLYRAEPEAGWLAVVDTLDAAEVLAIAQAATEDPSRAHGKHALAIPWCGRRTYAQEDRAASLLVRTLVRRAKGRDVDAWLARLDDETPELEQVVALAAHASMLPKGASVDARWDETVKDIIRVDHFARTMRAVFERMPLARRSALIEGKSFDVGGYDDDDRQGCGAWHYADLAPTKRMLERVCAEVDANRPTDRAVEVLVAFGDLARDAVRAGALSKKKGVRETYLRVLAKWGDPG